jgi:hypothetical protein
LGTTTDSLAAIKKIVFVNLNRDLQNEIIARTEHAEIG